jgi:hypothetical protein
MALKAEGAPPREGKKMIAGFSPVEVSKATQADRR